jgi:hypothetical protein
MRNLSAIALGLLLALGAAGSAGASTVSYTGTLTVGLGTLPPGAGGGAAQIGAVTVGGHLSTLAFVGGEVGPITTVLPVTASASLSSVLFTGVQNLSGTITGISGGPPLGSGQMSLQGMGKICVVFPGCIAAVTVPLSGMGVGGTQTFTGVVNVTLQHAPWTLGQPVMTIHTAASNITTPAFPGGFAHGPASLTSTTAQNSGVVQLVTASKVSTSLIAAFPELPVFSILNLHFFGPTTTLPSADVTLCHARRPGKRKTLVVSPSRVASHLAHGDTLGPCNG